VKAVDFVCECKGFYMYFTVSTCRHVVVDCQCYPEIIYIIARGDTP
jgi:hypothetical protein